MSENDDMTNDAEFFFPSKKPKRLTSNYERECARRTRNSQWEFMEKVIRLGTVWVCWWNKDHHIDETKAPEDLHVCCLFTGMELLSWLHSHPDWWLIGEWDDERYGAPVQVTPAGRRAFEEREKYDMELVMSGLVEPGVCTMPARINR